jgi:hypothetical protein
MRPNPDARYRDLERRARETEAPDDLARFAQARLRAGEYVEPWELLPISHVFIQAYRMGQEGRVEAVSSRRGRQRFYVGASGSGVTEDWENAEQLMLSEGYILVPSTPWKFTVGERRRDPRTLRGLANRMAVEIESLVEVNEDVLPRGFVAQFNTAISRGHPPLATLSMTGSPWGPDVWGLTLKIPPRVPRSALLATSMKGAGPEGGGGGWILVPSQFRTARIMNRVKGRWKNNPIPEAGDRIELVHMDDPYPIQPGTQGTVTDVQLVNLGGGMLGGTTTGGFFQVSVDWDNGRSLMLSIPPDRIRILGKKNPRARGHGDSLIRQLYRQWTESGDETVRDKLMHELARRGRLWATLISGYHHYVMVRVHADFDNPRGKNGKYFFEIEGGDIKDMTPKSRLRITLERLRRDYGVRSR